MARCAAPWPEGDPLAHVQDGVALQTSILGVSTSTAVKRRTVYYRSSVPLGGVSIIWIWRFWKGSFAWFTDSDHWLQKSLALHNLQELYPDVDIAEEYAGGTDPSKESYTDEAFPVQWEAKQPLGVSLYLPGQFTSLYPVVKQSQGRIYFAGEHLSVHRSWVFGALDSARFAVAQLLGEDIQYLKPL